MKGKIWAPVWCVSEWVSVWVEVMQIRESDRPQQFLESLLCERSGTNLLNGSCFSLWPCLNTHLLLHGPAGFYGGKLKVNLLFREHTGAFGEVRAQSTLESYQSICTPAHSNRSFFSALVTTSGEEVCFFFLFFFPDYPNIQWKMQVPLLPTRAEPHWDCGEVSSWGCVLAGSDSVQTLWGLEGQTQAEELLPSSA